MVTRLPFRRRIARRGRLARRTEGLVAQRLVRHLLGTLTTGETCAITSVSEIDIVGHRIVHGGPNFELPVVLTPEMRAAIASDATLAPLHIEVELEGMKIVESILGPVTQVGVFDTGFYRQIPLSSAIYPGPYDWFKRGVHGYGFHGINHQYCAKRAARLVGKDPNSLKIVSCHLGMGCSVAAIDEGRSLRYHDGVHSARRLDDGDAFGVGGSWGLDVSDAHGRPQLSTDGQIAESRIRSAGNIRILKRYAGNTGRHEQGTREGKAGI